MILTNGSPFLVIVDDADSSEYLLEFFRIGLGTRNGQLGGGKGLKRELFGH